MKLVDELHAEHRLIERVAGSFRTWLDLHLAGEAPADDGEGFLRFFELFAGRYHHAREEDLLVPALVLEAGLPGDRGPIAVILDDHRSMEILLASFRSGLAEGRRDADWGDLVVRYTRALWGHIDAEDSVLFPESVHRLYRVGVAELPARPPDAEEQAARAEGESLVGLYPPLDDKQVIRGDGCVVCEAYGTRCRGVEVEWWNESEWSELPGRIGG